MCRRVLTKEGFEVDIAVNGIIAQDMIEKRQYHICLIDIRTPEMNGTELYHWLQKKYPRLVNQVVFTTGGVMDEKAMAFIEHSGSYSAKSSKVDRKVSPKKRSPRNYGQGAPYYASKIRCTKLTLVNLATHNRKPKVTDLHYITKVSDVIS
jgi:CheY-like chemotaxis protein